MLLRLSLSSWAACRNRHCCLQSNMTSLQENAPGPWKSSAQLSLQFESNNNHSSMSMEKIIRLSLCSHKSYVQTAIWAKQKTIYGTCFILASSRRVCSSFRRSFLFPTKMMGTLGQKCLTSGVHFSGMFSIKEKDHKFISNWLAKELHCI